MEHKGFSDVAREMQVQTAELRTKADKIRALAKAGYKRQQIADFLGIRYQHVRNVLIDDERRAKALGEPMPPDTSADKPTVPLPAEGKPPKPPKRTVKVKISTGGQLALPPHMLETLGWKDGDTVWVNLEGDGEIRLADVHAVTRRIQAYVRENLPNLGTVDDFLAWKREEAQQEERRMQRWSGESPGEGQ
jgi:bifunctional DNA-binding transcriptional regulator/antitoxin component of YhaV-PrlF toxin-antitoxin module